MISKEDLDKAIGDALKAREEDQTQKTSTLAPQASLASEHFVNQKQLSIAFTDFGLMMEDKLDKTNRDLTIVLKKANGGFFNSWNFLDEFSLFLLEFFYRSSLNWCFYFSQSRQTGVSRRHDRLLGQVLHWHHLRCIALQEISLQHLQVPLRSRILQG
jgi:hypothetical protein